MFKLTIQHTNRTMQLKNAALSCRVKQRLFADAQEKAARFRAQRERGFRMHDCLWKHNIKHVSRATAASKTFSIGTMSGQFSGNQTLCMSEAKKQILHRKSNEAEIKHHVTTEASQHPCASAQWEKEETSSSSVRKPVHQKTEGTNEDEEADQHFKKSYSYIRS